MNTAMKQLLPTLLIPALVLAACGEKKAAPPVEQRPSFSGEPGKDIVALLPIGTVTAERMDGTTPDDRMSYLYNRYRAGLRAHYDWYVEYLETHTGRPLPYHEYFALSPEEYDEMNGLLQKVRYRSTGRQPLEIVRRNGGIGFKAKKKLAPFRSVAFDPDHLDAYIGEYKLVLTDTFFEATDENLFGSPRCGYTWRYEEPADLHLEAMKDIPGLNVIQYKLTLGQLKNPKCTLLHLQGVEIRNGHKLVDVDLPVTF